MVPEEDLTCECGAPLVCFVCDACPAHCALRDPDACWQAHESWRLGGPDTAFESVTAEIPRKPGKPITRNGVPIQPAPEPRWPKND